MKKECYKGEKIYHCQRYQLTNNIVQDSKALLHSFQDT
jgi:hypothetical protein